MSDELATSPASPLRPVYRSTLVRLLGFPATLVHGDTTVLDRWLWLRARLPVALNAESLLDVGCGAGAFTIGAARRGYSALGLSWDKRNQDVAGERARLCRVTRAKFEIQDVRFLGERKDLISQFDVVICLENIEHILDDKKLMRDMADCLKPGGRLLLTTPNLYYRPISPADAGPFLPIEDGRHVRRGYSSVMLSELCIGSGLRLEEISFCTGVVSQKLTALYRTLCRIHPILAWLALLPLRILPPMIDRIVTGSIGWPLYSICLQAYKPRLATAI